MLLGGNLAEFLTTPTIQKRFLARAYHFVDHAIIHYRLIILRKSETIPEHVTCPITTELMRDPVVDQARPYLRKKCHRTLDDAASHLSFKQRDAHSIPSAKLCSKRCRCIGMGQYPHSSATCHGREVLYPK